MISEHLFYQAMLADGMQLNQAGIFLKCRCGSTMAAGMAQVQFDDHGRVKVGAQPLRCPVCGAIYRRGERLSYRLGHVNNGRR